MKIRRYTCKDMQEALLKVKMDLGSEAVIMNSKKVRPKGLKGLFSKPMIEVVAAIDDDYVRPEKPKYNQRQAAVYQSYQPQIQPNPIPVVQVPAEVRMPAMQTRTGQAETKAAEVAAAARENVGNNESSKISELEEKVRNMENMIGKIYELVQNKDKPEKQEPLSGNNLPEQEEDAKVRGKTEFPARTGTDPLVSLRDALFEKDVEPKLIEKILDKIRERGGSSLSRDDVYGLASKVMTVLLGEPEPIKLIEGKKPHVAIFIGPTGVGKTTTLAKIAADFTFRQKKVGLITADTYRIAAVEQLKTYAEILNLQVTVVYSPGEIKDAVSRLGDNDLILIDTAGRSHKNKAHFDELKALVSAANADETYLVISCNTSRTAVKEILEYYAFIKNYKLLFTKLDESPSPGVILNARYMTGKPLSYTTAGQSVPDDLDIANVRQLVTCILNGSV